MPIDSPTPSTKSEEGKKNVPPLENKPQELLKENISGEPDNEAPSTQSSELNSQITLGEKANAPKLSDFAPNVIIPVVQEIFDIKGYFPAYEFLFNYLTVMIHPTLLGENDSVKSFSDFKKNILLFSPMGHELDIFLYNFAATNKVDLYQLDILALVGYLWQNQEFYSPNDAPALSEPPKQPQILIVNWSLLLPLLQDAFGSKDGAQGQPTTAMLGLVNFILAVKRIFPHVLLLFIASGHDPILTSLWSIFDLRWNLSLPDLGQRIHYIESLLAVLQIECDAEHLGLQLEGFSYGAIREFFLGALQTSFITQQLSSEKTAKPPSTEKFIAFLDQNCLVYDSADLQSPPTSLRHGKISSSTLAGLPLSPNLQDGSNRGESQEGGNLQLNVRFESQLYLDAASKHYEDLSVVLDKMTKGIILNDVDREYLRQYSFILNVEPQKAMQKLHKAKKSLEKILAQ